MFANARPNSALRIEVPKPLESFTDEKISPANVAVVERNRDPRLLSPVMRRRVRRSLRALDYLLSETGTQQFAGLLSGRRRAVMDARLKLRTAEGDAELEAARREYIAARKVYADTVALLDIHLPWIDRPWDVLIDEATRAKYYALKYTLRDVIRFRAYVLRRIDEDMQARKIGRARKVLKKGLDKEAVTWAKIIQKRWSVLGHSYTYTVHRGQRTISKTHMVGFQRAVVCDDRIYYQIKSTSVGLFGQTKDHMPKGVSVNKLITPDVLRDLTHATRRLITTPHTEDQTDFQNGAWVILDRLGRGDILPDHVNLKDVWVEYPEAERLKIPLPLAVRRGMEITYYNLKRYPHMGIFGQTGGGKTNVFDVMIGTVVKFHPPSEVRLVLADLKEGVGFSRWETVQHLAAPVADDMDKLLDLLKKCEALRKERTLTIRGVADNIEDYNSRVASSKQMAHVLLILDEYQQVAANKGKAPEIHSFVQMLTAKGRNVGIHVVIGAQTPYANDIPSFIKAQLGFIATARQRLLGASLTTFGSKEATELPSTPGRMLVDDGMSAYQIQVPFCGIENIRAALDTAIGWPAAGDLFEGIDTAAGWTFDRDTLLQIIMGDLEGKAAGKDVYGIVKERGISRDKTYQAVNDLIQEVLNDGGQLEYGGDTYRIVKDRRLYSFQITDTQSVHYIGPASES